MLKAEYKDRSGEGSPAPRRVKFITLGCKVNQYETQGMREDLQGRGVQEIRGREEVCDFVVINTCTVTREADRENRYWIRRMRRENPSASIVVTGCYVERNRCEIEKMEEVDLVLSNHEKVDLASHVLPGCGSPEVQDAESERVRRRTFMPQKISRFQGRGRAFIKIQDGCNHACSFCKVVLVRGRSRSRALPDIVEEARRLSDSGYREIVFAGIQLGAYGLDLGDEAALTRVIEACAAISGIERIRLSSIEPTDVKPELIRTLRDVEKCCPHLHIPLQSGDDGVLAGMNRRHGRSFYIDLIHRLRDAMPDFALSLDVMAGFPGEDEAAFQNTVNLLRQVQPLKCHVFPYSSREGTKASRLSGENAPEVIKERVRTLIRLADNLGGNFRQRFLDRRVRVLVEKKMKRGGLLQGLTEHYLKVCFQGPEEWVGCSIPVDLLSLEGDVFLGRTAIRNEV